MAEAGDVDLRLALQIPAEHGHRVGVVQHDGIRAVLLDVARDLHHGRRGAQEAEDAGRAAGVADVDVYAVLLRDLDIGAENARAAREDGDDHAVRALERDLPVEGGGDLRFVLAGGDDLMHRAVDEVQTVGIDVHQGQLAVGERREGEKVLDQCTGEAEAARADKRNFLHVLFLRI